MSYYTSACGLVGNTPLLKLENYGRQNALAGSIFGKLEGFNPAGSAKDRVVLRMIEDAEKSGALRKGATIIEPTSGNTGIGLCAVAVPMGYKVVIVMPETMSEERRRIMRQFGAEIVLTKGSEGMKGSINKAHELAQQTPGAFVPSQFTNLSNPAAHKATTGPEIFRDLDGKVDIFVAGIGTGGTITGVGEFLKEKNQDIKIVGVEPSDSPYLTKGKSGPHGLQGIGAGFMPEILNLSVVDKIMTATLEDAVSESKSLAKSEGILVGISSGAVLSVAKRLAMMPENSGKNIVVLFPDSAERYISTALFD